MASESVKRGVKRLLQEYSAENYESGEMVQKSNRINSKRWRRMFNSESAEESMQCHNVDAFEHPENQYEGGDQNTAAVVITPRRVSRRMRQLLEQYCPQNHETGDTVEEGRPESNSSDSQTEHYDGRFRVDDQCTILAADGGSFVAEGGQCSQSVGQALYQRSKQGLNVTYHDFGDNIYTCNYCGACFWRQEAIKNSPFASPVYTNCCKKGEIKIEQPKSTPAFLENLLNPDNGRESKLFRENISV